MRFHKDIHILIAPTLISIAENGALSPYPDMAAFGNVTRMPPIASDTSDASRPYQNLATSDQRFSQNPNREENIYNFSLYIYYFTLTYIVSLYVSLYTLIKIIE